MSSEPRQQHRYFCTVLIPELFFSNPDGFLDLLSGSGERYVNFLWERSAEAEGVGSPLEPAGLSCRVHQPDSDHRLGMIIMPEAEYPDETQLIGLLYRSPKLKMKGIKRGEARLITLDKGFGPLSGYKPWIYSETMRTGERQAFDTPVDVPDQERFLAFIIGLTGEIRAD